MTKKLKVAARPFAPKFKVGDKVRTNARYNAQGWKPRDGVIISDYPEADTYRVRLEGFTKPQVVHSSFLEKRK